MTSNEASNGQTGDADAFAGGGAVMTLTPAAYMAMVFADAQSGDVQLNMYATRRAARMAEAVSAARDHARLFADPFAADAIDLAERAAFIELSVRLRISEDAVRAQVSTASHAMAHLPMLWREAQDGFASWRVVERAVAAQVRVSAPVDGSPEEKEAEQRAFAQIDAAVADWAAQCTLAEVNRRLRTLTQRLLGAQADVRHARALRERKVIVDHCEDGMSWISAYVPTHHALAIKRRLTSTAKHLQKAARRMPGTTELRTRDQIRADLFTDWLGGVGTDQAVQTKVFVTIPISTLAERRVPGSSAPSIAGAGPGAGAGAGPGAGAGTGSTSGAAAASGAAVGATAGPAGRESTLAPFPPAVPEITGHGPVSSLVATQIFLDAPSFRRVLVDPFASVVVDLERTSRVATQAQRDWLALQHGTCARDGCDRLALDADIDHITPWSEGGLTNLAELRPLCPRDHTHRHRTKVRYRSRPDGSVQVATPSGLESQPPPPLRAVSAASALRTPRVLPDDAPAPF